MANDVEREGNNTHLIYGHPRIRKKIKKLKRTGSPQKGIRQCEEQNLEIDEGGYETEVT